MNRQSNVYTVIYIIVLVAVVGAALAFTSMSLKDRQNDNMAADKMRQILASVHIVPADKGDIIPEFKRVITAQYIVNSDGERVDGDAFAVNMAAEVRKPVAERQLPVYEATLDGDVRKYILPVYGAGLWGPIWGYMALDADGSTVYGAFFAHQGETPGLGAEIEKPFFSDRFQGKHMFKGDTFLPIAVVKAGQKPSGDEDYVDGISGGTITSKGVGAMIDDCLRPYASFLQKVSK
ncbi:MAG: NADH:ubiquinone reductase (Na(+)-transporting) subunit C [Muribaculaceae bacterium]|nr:NADH:ubiquinone reductase (Na(+)-transporting) subunit C [Muribaculaceae bacterium]